MTNYDRWLTVESAAELVHASIITVRRWVKEGKLSSRRVGRRLLIDPEEIDRILNPPIVITRGKAPVYGLDRPIEPEELDSMCKAVLNVLVAGDWPVSLLPITAESLRQVLLDQVHAGALFWRCLARGLNPQPKRKTLTKADQDELNARIDEMKSGKRQHLWSDEET